MWRRGWANTPLWGELIYLIGLEQSHAYLNPSPLAVRDFIQTPVKVYVKQSDELLSSLSIHILNPKYHLPSFYIALQMACT